jgi:hypothetical protein
MAGAGNITIVRGACVQAAPQLVELSAAWIHPRASTGGVWLARIADFRRMARISSDRPDGAVCGELQSRLDRRLLN